MKGPARVAAAGSRSSREVFMWKTITTLTLVAIAGGAAGYNLSPRAQGENVTAPPPGATPENVSELELANAGLQRELRGCTKSARRMLREQAVASRVVEPPSARQAASGVPTAEVAEDEAAPESDYEPTLLRREYLDERIESLPEDSRWRGDVDSAAEKALSAWPGAETLSTQCSKALVV